MKIKLFSIAFLFVFSFGFAQQLQLSPEATISVLTIGPGDNLNDSFGHNAFRIKDTARGIDLVYGYGEYDFDAPNFYLKFAQGKLNYLISKTEFSRFYNFYVHYDRTIKEQVLNLTIAEKERLFNYLQTNYQPENRRYLYDFFYDNCATKIRDVAEIATNSAIEYQTPENFEPKTFRTLIHDQVGLNTWGSFGIDIALGSVIDQEATAREHMFLPKYIHAFFAEAQLNSSKPLVKRSSILYQSQQEESSNFLLSPLMIIGFISLIIIYITYKDSKNNDRSKWLDISLFGITGLVGIVILLLWFATDHSATAQNYNVLWAVPLNLLVIAQLFKTRVKNWFRGYLKFLVIMLTLMTLHWCIGVQVFALALIPLMIALLIRYIYLLRYFKTK